MTTEYDNIPYINIESNSSQITNSKYDNTLPPQEQQRSTNNRSNITEEVSNNSNSNQISLSQQQVIANIRSQETANKTVSRFRNPSNIINSTSNNSINNSACQDMNYKLKSNLKADSNIKG
jgi:hypothetical protein